MVNPTTFYIPADTLAWCEAKVASGRFKSFSDMLDFTLGLYHDQITVQGVRSIPKIRRSNLVKKSARVNTWTLERLLDTGFFDKSEIAEYALTNYRHWIGETD